MKLGYLLLVSASLFGAAFFALRFQDPLGSGAISVLATLGIALPTFYALFRYLGARRAAVSLVALGLFAFAVETTGTVTGVPYGPFYYGDSLGLKVGGLVPLVLPVAYCPLVIGAVAAATHAPSKAYSGRWFAWMLRSAVLLVLVDGVLDPGAAALGFWVWPEGGLYYGVPLSNYAGWLLSGVPASALLLLCGGWTDRGPPPPGLLDSMLLALAFWSGVVFFSGLWFPAVLGAVLYWLLLFRRFQVRAEAATTAAGAE